MTDRECVELLQWAMPVLGLRWRGFKDLRRQVCRRLSAHVAALGLDAASYRRRVEEDPEERRALDALCFITISRFYRDRQVFDALRERLLPSLAEAAVARGADTLHVWSAGCASGEEPYTVAILWHLELATRYPSLRVEILATDFDETVLARAARGCYEPSSLRELPEAWQSAAFTESGDELCLRAPFRESTRFRRADIRHFTPPGPLDLVFCRNVAFTYFDEAAQRAFVERIAERLVPGGLLVVGNHEALPEDSCLSPLCDVAHVYMRG